MKKVAKKLPAKKKVVSKKKATKKIVPDKKFISACKYLGISPKLPDVSMLPKRDQLSLVSYYQITKIIEMENKKNNNWQPNWNDSSQYKYCVWQQVQADEKRPAGFGFSTTYHDGWTTNSDVGSRLLVGNSETALRLGKELKQLFINWMLFVD
jgi:hypothetical protein